MAPVCHRLLLRMAIMQCDFGMVAVVAWVKRDERVTPFIMLYTSEECFLFPSFFLHSFFYYYFDMGECELNFRGALANSFLWLILLFYYGSFLVSFLQYYEQNCKKVLVTSAKIRFTIFIQIWQN